MQTTASSRAYMARLAAATAPKSRRHRTAASASPTAVVTPSTPSTGGPTPPLTPPTGGGGSGGGSGTPRNRKITIRAQGRGEIYVTILGREDQTIVKNGVKVVEIPDGGVIEVAVKPSFFAKEVTNVNGSSVGKKLFTVKADGDNKVVQADFVWFFSKSALSMPVVLVIGWLILGWMSSPTVTAANAKLIDSAASLERAKNGGDNQPASGSVTGTSRPACPLKNIGEATFAYSLLGRCEALMKKGDKFYFCGDGKVEIYSHHVVHRYKVSGTTAETTSEELVTGGTLSGCQVLAFSRAAPDTAYVRVLGE